MIERKTTLLKSIMKPKVLVNQIFIRILINKSMKMKIIYRNYYIYTFGCDEKNIRKTNNFQELIKC